MQRITHTIARPLSCPGKSALYWETHVLLPILFAFPAQAVVFWIWRPEFWQLWAQELTGFGAIFVVACYLTIAKQVRIWPYRQY